MLSQSCIGSPSPHGTFPRRGAFIHFSLAGTAELFLVSPPEAVVYLKGINPRLTPPNLDGLLGYY
jgi:hypothetical protein